MISFFLHGTVSATLNKGPYGEENWTNRIQSKIGCWFGGHFCKKILMPSITIKKIKWNLLYTIKRVYFHKNSVWLAYFKYKMAKFVRIYSKIGQKPSFCLQIFQTVHQKVCYKAIEKQNYQPFVIILEGWWYNLTIRTIIIQKFEKNIYIFNEFKLWLFCRFFFKFLKNSAFLFLIALRF